MSKVFVIFIFICLLPSHRNTKFENNITRAIEDVLKEIPCHDDAVVEVFYGYRNRDGDVEVNKYVPF